MKQPNGLEFMERISEYCPMEWRILSGDEEAIYGFNGALGDQLNDGRHYTTIDIGGGSTELALGNKDGVYWIHSYPIGLYAFNLFRRRSSTCGKKLTSCGIR